MHLKVPDNSNYKIHSYPIYKEIFDNFINLKQKAANKQGSTLIMILTLSI